MSTPLLRSLATGLLLGVAYPSGILPTWLSGWLALVALVPLLSAICSDRTMLPKLIHLYLGMAVFHGIANWWVGSYQEQTDPFLLASGIALMIGHPFFLLLPWATLVYIRKRLSLSATLLSSPFVLTGFEWLHGQTDASYPWLSIGYSLIDTPLVQLADIVGVYGLGFFIATINAAVVAAIVWPSVRFRFVAAATLICTLWAVHGVLAAAAFDVDKQDQRQGRPLNVALMQSNDNPWDKWTSPVQQADRTRSFSDARLDSLQSLGAVDLVVWPETAIPFPIRHSEYATQWSDILQWTSRRSISLLSGLSDLYVYPRDSAPASARMSQADPSLRFDFFNAAGLISDAGFDVHYKTCLTPFAERLPFADQLVFAQSWFQWGVGISSWGKGASRTPLTLRRDSEEYKIGTIICIESIYPDMVRDLVRNGATMLCVITNDAWYNGTPGPRQHHHIARMRAIEQRRWLFRCALSGVTGIIAPDGTSVKELPEVTSGALVGNVYNVHTTSLYAKFGDVIPMLSSAFTLVAIGMAGYAGLTLRRKQPQLSTTSQSTPTSTSL